MKHARILLALAGAAALCAHPMGNFSVNHYARIMPAAAGVDIRYVLDLAEIPTFELMQQWNMDASTPRTRLEERASGQAREWATNIVISVNGRQVTPRFEGAGMTLADGAGNMPVMHVVSRLHLPVAFGRLEYEDRNYSERAGWKEIVIAAGRGAAIRKSTQDDQDRSAELTAYPQDPTLAPPQDLRASLEWSGGPAPTQRVPAAEPQSTSPVTAASHQPVIHTSPVPAQPPTAGTVVRGDFLSRLLHNREIGWGMALLGVGVAFCLGALHALSPGHGKTIVAAYLVGSRGTFKHAIFLGGMVTFTHTISVFFLGLCTLFLSQYVLPEKIYPVLGAISGLSIVWIGVMLFFKRARLLRGHEHTHDHPHPHGHDHVHGPGDHTHVPEGEVSVASLIALGASGGLVPCPSALVILLSAVALGRVGLGMVLLIGFSTGLAIVLMGIGVLVLYAKHLLPDSKRAAANPAFRLLPVLSAAVIVCIGLVMTGVSLGIIRPDRVLGLT